MATAAKLASTLRELAARRFVSAGYRKGGKNGDGARLFRGPIASPKGELRALLSISDWDFLEYPTIQIEGGLEKFPGLRPHLDRSGDLCYFSRRTAVLDRYDPATAIAQCLEQAQAVLAKILGDRDYLAKDIQNEFLVHWERQEPPAWLVHLGSVKKNAAYAPMHFGQDDLPAIIADDLSQAQGLATAMQWGALSQTANRCWLYRTNKMPPVPNHFSRTVTELFDWLRTWDQRLYNGVQHLLTTAAAYEYMLLPIAVHTPVGWIGFKFEPNCVKAKTPAEAKRYLHAHGARIPIDRLMMVDISPAFVHSRNLAFPDLTNKRLTLIGCGAIGSWLAAALVRLGAGQGPNGLLRLIDEDVLLPENLGRHLLGYNRLDQPKATALRKELLAQFPLSRIEPVVGAAQKSTTIFQADLVIDATGDEIVSEYFNADWLARGRPCPLLFVWIKGNGECVQSLWADGPEHACFRCLHLNDPEVHREERYPILKNPPARKHLGCQAFTPYAVSAPMQAAALAADVICDWMQGRASPRYRTRCRENVDVLPVSNGDPFPLEGCPACATP